MALQDRIFATFYDPLIGKAIFYGGSRYNVFPTFLEKLHIEGIKTNIPAILDAVRTDAFRSGDYDTGLLGK